VTGLDLGKYSLGWNDGDAFVAGPRREPTKLSCAHLASEAGARVDDAVPAELPDSVRAQAGARRVASSLRGRSAWRFVRPSTGSATLTSELRLSL
jgi:hypothetical protein